jgi:hypothetical protein
MRIKTGIARKNRMNGAKTKNTPTITIVAKMIPIDAMIISYILLLYSTLW